ncbi:glycosyltransferase family 2 protein [Riemerella columbina]|uniref:glycosyltransferase family 2 protein n=1 Tax=Riemerella columbina TaxID=103810 RepID=UPI00036B2A4D|nr:glycosyltransferase [Riemerella columbina]
MNYAVAPVSVVMITYGHEKYISKAIEGVFIQKTNFPIEFIIANDNSPDNTDEVVRNMITKSPDHIHVRYTKHEENKGMMGNFIWALQQAKGKYIAYFDGDDYWIDEYKLQKQYDFMEANPEYAICCHNFKGQLGDDIIETTFIDKIDTNNSFDIIDLTKKNFIPTLSSFFRNIPIEFPEWMLKSPLGDLFLFLNISKYGKIKCLNEKMGVYRMNVGVWNGKKRNYKKLSKLYYSLAKHFNDTENVSKSLLIQSENYFLYHFIQMDIKSLLINDEFKKLSIKRKLKIIFKKIRWTFS